MPGGRGDVGAAVAASVARIAGEPQGAADARGSAGNFSARRCGAVVAGAGGSAAELVARGEGCAGGARAARGFVLSRSGARHGASGERGGRRIVGVGGGRARHCGRIRESARVDRSQAAARRGAWADGASTARDGALGDSWRRALPEPTSSSTRGCCSTAGAWCSAMCWRGKRWRRRGGVASGAAAMGGSRRSARRTVCRGILGRTIRAAGGGGIAARAAA